ncbi:MAG: serine hydroxymethyltransferase [Alphaproteobacteria bacterium]|nr:serine hydroxymethyltransferase [Alphaproteobacteria bacterium]
MSHNFFHQDLRDSDPEIYAALERELHRQSEGIELIASENLVSWASMQAIGNVSTNKYAEGYPGRRYYGGCEFVDEIEEMGIARAKKLFNCAFVNIQPHSGANANQAVFLALLKPGDTFLGLALDAGGHLTHGAAPNLSGKWFNPVGYGLDENGFIDMADVDRLAHEHKPKLIIAGGSAYSREIDFAAFRKIADDIGAYFMVDMAHFCGLVAGGVYSSPISHAHVVTSTTHKTLRCGRGGMILSDDEVMSKKINSAVFPGLQGGPLLVSITSKAVGFGEALRPDFKDYCAQVVANAKALGEILVSGGVSIVSGGTDSHLLLVDLRPKSLTGKVVEAALERAAITCNKNGVPNDPQKPQITSGVRLGSPAGTTRGLKEVEFRTVGALIVEVMDGLISNGEMGNAATEASVRERVNALCAQFPLYSNPIGRKN